nr:putative polyprotein [Tanacetum cinerariifolium]
MLDTSKFEQWQFRMQQYLQHEHYALWEVIEFRDSYKAPENNPSTTTTSTMTTSTTSGDKSGRMVTLTTEDMQKKKNDVKSRTTLRISLLDEHQLRFSKHKTAKELWAAILKTFVGNEATKKTKKNPLKQQYKNFRAEGAKMLEQTFTRLQVIIGQLQFMGVEVEQDDLNQQFLTSLAPEWLMHTIVWRNRSDLDTMSLDDLYNHLKVYEAEVQKKSEPNTQNMAFISSTKHSRGNDEVNIASVYTASGNVPTASANVATVSINQETACAYIASQSGGSQIKFEDINQINEDDMEEMDIKWNMALLSMRADKFWKKTGKKISIQGSDVAGFNKSKVECFNYHKMGHFTPKTLMAIDEVGWDWSYMANDEEDHALVAEAPTEFTLMANTTTENKAFDNSLCSKDCKRNNDSLNSKITDLIDELFDANNMIYHYKTLEFYDEGKVEYIETLKKELEILRQEKEVVDGKLAGLLLASKNLDNLIESQRSDKSKEGLGYTVVPPPVAQLYLSPSPKKDLSWTSLPECANDTITRTPKQNGMAERRNRSLIEAARTMLADAKLPVTFWAEVVNTACYVQNKVLVNKAYNKTPYEFIQWDEGYFLGYSMYSKAFRIFNKRTKRVEENVHIEFLENKAIEKGSGLNWLFDIDSLTKSMNYVPVVDAGTHSTNFSEPLSETRLISKRVTNQAETPSLDNILTLTNQFANILGDTSNSEESNGVEADVSNMEITITTSPTPTLRIHRDHPKSQIIGPANTPIQTRNKSKEKVWSLVDCPKGVRPIGTKWVLKNKKDERGIVIRNKAKLVAQGHTQEEGINYDEVFAPVARIEAIRLFLAYASFMGFTVYQIDVKSAFLYGTIDEEVYVMQPLRFQNPEYPARVYKVEKAMYGLHQAPRACEFEALMHKKFQMSAMGELNFFLGLQVLQKEDGIFLSQDKYGKDGTGKDVDLYLYRSMIGSLMYLTASRPDIMFAVCACARHQVTPKECHLHAVKRIFRYLKGHPKLGLWYPNDSPFDLVVYSDSDYGGATQDRKSTSGGCQFLGRRLISWQCKKQKIVATSTTEAEYVAAASCYRQVLWIQNQLLDYGLSMPCETLSKEISTSILRLLYTAKTLDLVWIWLGGDYGNVFLNGF